MTQTTKQRCRRRWVRFYADTLLLFGVLSFGATEKIFSPAIAVTLGFLSFGVVQNEEDWVRGVNDLDHKFTELDNRAVQLLERKNDQKV